MRYLPHSAAERADMLAVIGATSADALFGAVPEAARLKAPLDLPAHSPEFLVEAHMRGLAQQEPCCRRRPVLRRRRRLSPSRAGDRRSSDPAQRVADRLHALPARSVAGHAADAVRVPDPGRAPDRHGGRQRLDVRRLDRHRRGRADGAPPDPQGQDRPLGRPPPALSRRRPHLSRQFAAPHLPAALRRKGRATSSTASTTTPPPSSSRRRTSSAICATSKSCRRGDPRQGRPADRRRHRSGLARPHRGARRARRRHRRLRRPVDRQRAQLRRPLCRA